jgi:hypothetical protein
MNSKKSSKPFLPPARDKVATTLITGSDPAKKPHANEADYPMGPPSAAMVHDFVGAAMLMLPAGLRTALGDKHLVSNALELETQEILVIIREEGTLAYVHLPILVKEMEEPGTWRGEGLVLLDITGSMGMAGAQKGEQLANKTSTKAARTAKPEMPQPTPSTRTPRRKHGK